MPRKRTSLDEEAFVEDYVSGCYTHRQLAAKHGVSVSLAKKIVSGRRRPELQKRIAAARQAARRRAEQRLINLLDAAVDALKRTMEGEAPAPAVAAAREVLNRTLGRPETPQAPAANPAAQTAEAVWGTPEPPGLIDLSPETRRLVLEELGGPQEDGNDE